jgi:hypothetical protein
MVLFYGPILLAFETEKEIILKGNHETILQNLTKMRVSFYSVCKITIMYSSLNLFTK